MERAPEGEFQETRTFCFCCSLKCGIILFGALVVLTFCVEVFNAAMILINEHFDKFFGIVYLIILIPYLVAVILQFYYWCSKDSKSSRAVLPWSFMIAGISSLLLAVWIIIYICILYKKDKVYTPKFDKSESSDPDADGNANIELTYSK